MIFVDREDELRVLEEAYERGGELVVVYGRRRVGKTFLLAFFSRGKDALYLVVNYSEAELALRDLARQFAEQAKLPFTPAFRSFSELYRAIAGSKFRLVIIDEFQRLHGTGGVTELQASWDRLKGWRDKVLILSGSAVGMMERIGLSPESPLYGRATRVLKLTGFDYRCARAFLRRYGEEDKVRAYAIFGGTPDYLARLDDRASLLENVRRLVLGRGAPLREEPVMLLSMELREPSRYLRILEAVAQGATKLGEIADYAGLGSGEASKYLRVLEKELGLLDRRYPVLERRRGRARYYLADNFFRFWFRFVFPYTHLLELGLEDKVLEVVKRELDAYASATFEEIALQHFALLAKEGLVSFTDIGRWWRGDIEIDGVAIDRQSKTAYFIEVKWSSKPVSRRELYRLASKAEEFPWRREREIYVLYSRAGFTFEGDEDVMLFSLRDLERDFEEFKPRVEPF